MKIIGTPNQILKKIIEENPKLILPFLSFSEENEEQDYKVTKALISNNRLFIQGHKELELFKFYKRHTEFSIKLCKIEMEKIVSVSYIAKTDINEKERVFRIPIEYNSLKDLLKIIRITNELDLKILIQ